VSSVFENRQGHFAVSAITSADHRNLFLHFLVSVCFDVKVAPFVSVRLIQVDYLRTQLHGATQNQPRVSAGIVLRF